MKRCKNCGVELHDLYCSHCGQKASVERITFAYLLGETFHFLTHIENGFLYTSWQMIIHPGPTVHNFIEGKRKRYSAPVAYFLIWITLYILLLYVIEKIFGENSAIDYKEYFGPSATTEFAITHLGAVLAIVIPFQALYLFLLVTEGIYNYFENVAVAFYVLGSIILFQSVFALVAVIIHLLFSVSVDIRISDTLKILYLSWFISSFIRLFSCSYKLLRVIAFVILAFGTFTIWRLYGFPSIAHFIQ